MSGRWGRPLDAFEEILWLSDRRHVLVAELSGLHSADQYRAAIEGVNRRHPHLSAMIVKEPRHRPRFEWGADVATQVVIEAADSVPTLTECAEYELNRPFDETRGPLSRWHMYVTGDRAVVCLASHHALLDGRSHMQLLDELMILLTTGETPEGTTLLPSLSELIGVPVPDDYSTCIQDGHGKVVSLPTGPSPKVQVIHHRLPGQVWHRVRQDCKARGLSLHSTLLSALTRAGNDLGLWGPENVRCIMPIDGRSQIGQDNAIGSFFILHPATIELFNDEDLWERATSICGLLEETRNGSPSKRFFYEVNALVRGELTPDEMLITLKRSYLAHQLMLTNYARYTPRTQFPNATINSLLTAGATGGPKTQKVSVSTVDEALSMTLASLEPEVELLARTAAILQSTDYRSPRA